MDRRDPAHRHHHYRCELFKVLRLLYILDLCLLFLYIHKHNLNSLMFHCVSHFRGGASTWEPRLFCTTYRRICMLYMFRIFLRNNINNLPISIFIRDISLFKYLRPYNYCAQLLASLYYVEILWFDICSAAERVILISCVHRVLLHVMDTH